MNLQELLEKYKNFPKKYLIVAFPAGFGLIFFVYGLILLFGQNQTSEDITFEQTSFNQKEEKKNIVVDVEGAVVNPGVYKLLDGARIQDVLVKAGGLSQNADRKWIAKNINLATKLTDGGKIFIPSINETSSNFSQNSQESFSDSLININNASLSQLDKLPGVGETTASKIILQRPYQSIEDLLSKKIVNKKVFDQIKSRITL